MADSKTSDLVMELNSMLFNVSVASAVGWRRYARRFKRCAPLFFAASGVACDAGAVVERTVPIYYRYVDICVRCLCICGHEDLLFTLRALLHCK
eukprot:scaffold28564_cov124-Skeletonema_marinoi.AAC.1